MTVTATLSAPGVRALTDALAVELLKLGWFVRSHPEASPVSLAVPAGANEPVACLLVSEQPFTPSAHHVTVGADHQLELTTAHGRTGRLVDVFALHQALLLTRDTDSDDPATITGLRALTSRSDRR